MFGIVIYRELLSEVAQRSRWETSLNLTAACLQPEYDWSEGYGTGATNMYALVLSTLRTKLCFQVDNHAHGDKEKL
jgi:hypothetical protein